MQMTPVTSSNVKAVGYDPAGRTMRVQFNSGTYDYADVPPEKHAALMEAESVGKHLNANFRGHHTATPVHVDEAPPEAEE